MYSELKQVELPLVKTLQKLDWEYIPSSKLEELRDSYDNPFILSHLKDAIIKLNSHKGITKEHADAIIHRLQRIDSNEEFSKWLKGEQSFKYSPSENAVSINLIDTENLTNNRFTVTNQFKQSITHGVIENEKHIKPDVVLFINGIPTTAIECKVLSTEESNYQEGIKQIERYQNHSPRMFVSNCFNVSTDGHILKYGATGSSSGYFFEWKDNGACPMILMKLRANLYHQRQGRNTIPLCIFRTKSAGVPKQTGHHSGANRPPYRSKSATLPGRLEDNVGSGAG